MHESTRKVPTHLMTFIAVGHPPWALQRERRRSPIASFNTIPVGYELCEFQLFARRRASVLGRLHRFNSVTTRGGYTLTLDCVVPAAGAGGSCPKEKASAVQAPTYREYSPLPAEPAISLLHACPTLIALISLTLVQVMATLAFNQASVLAPATAPDLGVEAADVAL